MNELPYTYSFHDKPPELLKAKTDNLLVQVPTNLVD